MCRMQIIWIKAFILKVLLLNISQHAMFSLCLSKTNSFLCSTKERIGCFSLYVIWKQWRKMTMFKILQTSFIYWKKLIKSSFGEKKMLKISTAFRNFNTTFNFWLFSYFYSSLVIRMKNMLTGQVWISGEI